MNIKKLRILKGITQKELSLMLKVKQSTVTKWETGKAKPRFDMLPELANILGCRIDDLFENLKSEQGD